MGRRGALERARREDKPIFLSIGYCACHWCHVMERESFEDPDIAALMNEHFVSIKVDREERPDLDQIYQIAVQLMRRSGGWPMTVFLTPDAAARSSAAPTSRRRRATGCPSFRDGARRACAEAYRERRGEVEQSGDADRRRHRARSTSARAATPTDPPADVAGARGASSPRASTSGTAASATRPKFPSTMRARRAAARVTARGGDAARSRA